MQRHKAPTFDPVFYRTYSRAKEDGTRESYEEVLERTQTGLAKLGQFTAEEAELTREMMASMVTLPSGRWMWVGGTGWIERPANVMAGYNCTSCRPETWDDIAYVIELLMMGCGVGYILEDNVDKLPPISANIQVNILNRPGAYKSRAPVTTLRMMGEPSQFLLSIGDSRQGWAQGIKFLAHLASTVTGDCLVYLDLGNIRKAGLPLKGFGGVSNPAKVEWFYTEFVKKLNQYQGRKLDTLAVSWIMCAMGLVVVAGSIRRSAEIAQFSSDDPAAFAKQGLWKQDDQGSWYMPDPSLDALRMANFTRVYHHKPTYDEVLDAVRLQYYSGEGAIMYAPEAQRRVAIGRENDPKYEDHLEHAYGLNPCFAAGTIVLTRDGYYPIETLVGKQVQVWDDSKWADTTFKVTGRNQEVFNLTLKSGEVIQATAYHKFILEDGRKVELKALQPGDRLRAHHQLYEGDHHEPEAYLKGYMVRPSRYDEDWLLESVSEVKAHTHPELLEWVETHRQEFPYEVLNWSLKSKLDFVDGVINGFLGQLSSTNKTWLQGFQLLLKTMGIDSRLKLDHRVRTKGERCYGEDLWRLIVTQAPDLDEVESVTLSHVAPEVYCCTVPGTHQMSLVSYVTGQCGEIVGNWFACNLSEVNLNLLDPFDFGTQAKAFKAGALSVVALLHQKFPYPKFQESRELDPIVAVCCTGLFDFFVHLFGADWLAWWAADRDEPWGELVPGQTLEAFSGIGLTASNEYLTQGRYFTLVERAYLTYWKTIVASVVTEYCSRHGLTEPNRYTAIQPSGSKSLLTGASPGWHPPKATRFIRRITFQREHPVAKACMDFGYKVTPSQSDKDETGRLLDDPFDPRVTEWLVEVPVEVPWACLPGCDQYDPATFSVKAQFSFYMQVQKYYTTFNTSATLEYRESEIEDLAQLTYDAIQNDEGYISAAVLARFDDYQTFPRLPFEPLTQHQYEVHINEVARRQVTADFYGRLQRYWLGDEYDQAPAACDSDKCLLPAT